MDQDENEPTLEDGEISDDSDNYTPLERPSNYSVVQPNPRLPLVVPQSESEDEIQTSATDSDSDVEVKKKKPRIKLKPNPRLNNQKLKKYDIWSSRAQDDALAETLNSCDVTTKDRSRSVETYDYSLGYKYYNEQETPNRPFSNKGQSHCNKRTREDRNNKNFKQRKRSISSEKMKGSKRIILDLTVDLECREEDIAKDIGNRLFEEKEDLILKIVNTLGKKRAIDIFYETKRIEEEGGMLILNQTRRRTPGGVFIYLVRNDYHLTPDEKNAIFGEEKGKYKQEMKARKKEKAARIKKEIATSKAKLLPDLLSRAELLASQNPTRKIEDADDNNFNNPPPTPETDTHENSNDGMDARIQAVNGSSSTLENARDKLCAYDEDFLDIGCSAEMDLF